MTEAAPGHLVVPWGLVVLVGPPASGKTGFVAESVAQGRLDPAAVVSSDDIRAELAGPGVGDAEVFEERDRRIAARLAAGRIAVAESTNVTPRARARLAHIARRFEAPITVLRFARPVSVLLRQNEERARNDVSPADIAAYAELMTRHASTETLRAEGATHVHDVPGRGEGVTAAEAAARFTFLTPPRSPRPRRPPRHD